MFRCVYRGSLSAKVWRVINVNYFDDNGICSLSSSDFEKSIAAKSFREKSHFLFLKKGCYGATVKLIESGIQCQPS